MSSSSEFLKSMKEAGEKHSAPPEFVTIAKIKIQFGYSGYLAGHRPSELFKLFDKVEDAEACALSVTARLAELGSKREAVAAVMFSVPEESNLSTLVTWNIKQVVMLDTKEDSEYQLFWSALSDADFPINEWFWGSYKNDVVGSYKKSGVTKKKYLSLPVEVFANEAEAKKASGIDAVSTSSMSKWSELAQETYEGNMEILENDANNMLGFLEKIKAGDNSDFPNRPLPSPLNPVTAKQYIADIYTIETSDIDQLIPF